MSHGLQEQVGAAPPKLSHPATAFATSSNASSLTTARTRFGAPSVRFDRGRVTKTPGLPPTAELLTDGGDARIVSGPRGWNQYGCSSLPDPAVLAFGSSTASTISPAGFAAAEALRERLNHAALFEEASVTYERELDRLRRELTTLCGLEELTGLEIIFGASGTDLHLFASQLMVDTGAPAPLIVRVEATETGRGVPDALAGRHFSDSAALGDTVAPNVPLDCGRPIDILEVKCRKADGTPRLSSAVDSEVEKAVVQAAAAGRRVLLALVDVSKTGLIAPSPACVKNLQRRFPALIEVLVDACQFRLASSTLKAYLEHDFLVAITGSKFITGPTFCGALMVPAAAAQRLRTRTLPRALKSYSAKAEWPRHWATRSALNQVANYGLLLRWEAALTELRAFCALPDAAVRRFLETFAQAVSCHLANDASFEALPAPVLNRESISPERNWDQLPTVFSFLLSRPSASGKRLWLTQEETKKVHELLREDLGDLHGASSRALMASRCQLGQPVKCGTRDGIPVSALRLCVSSRLIVEALSPTGRGIGAVIGEALAALDKTALLASLPLT